MNTAELKAERIRKGKTPQDMADVIEKSYDCYIKKEKGIVKCSPEEIVALAIDLELDFDKFNAIFFDGKLLFGKNEEKRCISVT